MCCPRIGRLVLCPSGTIWTVRSGTGRTHANLTARLLLVSSIDDDGFTGPESAANGGLVSFGDADSDWSCFDCAVGPDYVGECSLLAALNGGTWDDDLIVERIDQ